jgi:hypothetical protein
MEITWLSTSEVSQMLDVSGTYVRRITPDLMRNQPDAVRKVADKRGRPRWEWSYELVKAVKSKRNKRAKITNLTATSSATKEAQIDQSSDDAILPIQAQPEPQLTATIQADLTATNVGVTEEEVIFELGLHSQSDGNLMQVFTPDEYDRFKSMLIKLPIIEQNHNDLKESYEAHVETYRSENAYLRKSLETQQQITNQLAETHRKAIQGMNQRNYIEAQRLQEQNNPTIVLPKE